MSAQRPAGKVLLISPAICLAAALGLAACGGNAAKASSTSVTHPPASPVAASPVAASPELTADKAMCKTFNANIGNGGEYQIAQVLANSSQVSYKLRQDITKVLTPNSGSIRAQMKSDLRAQIWVSFDCAMVNVGRAPRP
jgi:ABC-type glycerol-3-phosphate transport system substrate-binding protein